MSVKSFKSTTSTKNSYDILSQLDDSKDIPIKKNKTQSTTETKPSTPVAPISARSIVQQQYGNKKTEKTANASAKARDVLSSVSKSTLKTNASVNAVALSSSSSNGSCGKLIVFAMLMLVFPVAAYYWCVSQSGFALGEIRSALVAVLVVNVLLFLYIILAVLEESPKKKEHIKGD